MRDQGARSRGQYPLVLWPRSIALKGTDPLFLPKWKHEFGGVTHGEFAKKNQKDTAVICNKNGITTIKIFWGGEYKSPDEISAIGEYISTVGEKYITEHYQVYGGEEPPKITHEAINDHYVEKSSFVKYCNNGKWVHLTGAD